MPPQLDQDIWEADGSLFRSLAALVAWLALVGVCVWLRSKGLGTVQGIG